MIIKTEAWPDNKPPPPSLVREVFKKTEGWEYETVAVTEDPYTSGYFIDSYVIKSICQDEEHDVILKLQGFEEYMTFLDFVKLATKTGYRKIGA